MRWSLKIGQIRGIPLYVHVSFLLIVAWVALGSWLQSANPAAMAASVLFVLSLFVCVVLHELGHALTAQRFGIRTRDVTLLPIGGVARLEGMPEEPRQELLVALAGPAVNVAIAGLLFAVLAVGTGFQPFGEAVGSPASFIQNLMIVNLVLVIFNLLPAFPMDGGRVFRSLLAMRFDYLRSTRIAAGVGQTLAVMFGLVGLFYNPFLILIAFFVYTGAAHEATMVAMRSAFKGVPVRSAMVTNFQTLEPGDSLQRAVELTLAGAQRDFPVVHNDRLAGILSGADLVEALSRYGHEYPVSEAMKRQFHSVEENEPLQAALARFSECNCSTLPVSRGGKLLGMLTTEGVGEFLRLRAALKQAPAQA